MNRIVTVGLAAALAATGFAAGAQEKQQMAFVVNGASDFWKLAEAGVAAAQAELPDHELQFRYPAQATAALQNALMDDLVAAGTDAIMISSVDPKTSTDAAIAPTAAPIRASGRNACGARRARRLPAAEVMMSGPTRCEPQRSCSRCRGSPCS